jgi:cardiolipin synthase A/B
MEAMNDYVPDWVIDVWPWVLLVVDAVIVLMASAHVVLTKKDSRAAIGWVGVIWLTPILGSVLYLTFGVNRIQRKARLLRGGRLQTETALARKEFEEEVLQRVLGDDTLHLAPLARFVSRLTHLPLLDGNRVTPLTTGRQAFEEMLAAIDEAKQTIGLMTYIFDNDSAGQQFADALARAHERGVAVRVLIDDVGARYTFPSIKWLLRRRGIPFVMFLPTLIPGRLHYANLRSHRKILVVDGQLGFTGGMNIRRGHLCEPGDRHPINDLHFRVEGPVLEQLSETFSFDWEFASGERLDNTLWFPRLSPVGQSLCRGLAAGPDFDTDKIMLTILGAIGCARDSIDIVTPYFLPEQPLITALNVAAMRGVAVNILLPEKNNLKTVQWACTAQLWQMLIRGCRVWLTPPPFDHSKIMIVDGVWSLVGSSNWDPRSLRLNFEFNVECYDRELASQLGALVQAKRSAAREITLAEVDSRPLWRRLRDGVCRLALPYL